MMNTMNHPFLPILALLVLVVIVGAKLRSLGTPKYRARVLLTANELEFFQRLRRALPDEYIFPQVALSALIGPTSHGKRNLQDFRKISQKRVDFAIYTSSLELLALIELDDRTHDRAKDAKRDAFVASAGIRTLRFESRNKPNHAEIRAAVFPTTVPAADGIMSRSVVSKLAV